jgi:hypothetical protein
MALVYDRDRKEALRNQNILRSARLSYTYSYRQTRDGQPLDCPEAHRLQECWHGAPALSLARATSDAQRH